VFIIFAVEVISSISVVAVGEVELAKNKLLSAIINDVAVIVEDDILGCGIVNA